VQQAKAMHLAPWLAVNHLVLLVDDVKDFFGHCPNPRFPCGFNSAHAAELSLGGAIGELKLAGVDELVLAGLAKLSSGISVLL